MIRLELYWRLFVLDKIYMALMNYHVDMAMRYMNREEDYKKREYHAHKYRKLDPKLVKSMERVHELVEALSRK